MLTASRLCASLPARLVLAVFSLTATYLLMPSVTYAGTWSMTLSGHSYTHTVNGSNFGPVVRQGYGPTNNQFGINQIYAGAGSPTGTPVTVKATLTGTITATWVPDPSLPSDPVPASSIVSIASTATAYQIVNGVVDYNGSSNDGYSDSPANGVSSTTRYFIHSGSGTSGNSFQLPFSLSAFDTSTNFAFASVGPVAVNTYPVIINLTGTTPDSGGGENILIGQGCSDSLACNALGVTFSNFQWGVSGQVFGAFQIASDQSWGHASNLFTDPDWMRANPQWCWSKDANETVSCTAQASINGIALGTVTGQKQVKVWSPYYYFKHNTGPTSAIGSNISTGGPNLIPPGMHFVAAVGTPALFSTNGAGQWLFVQIINTDHRQWYPLSFAPTTSGSGGVALDNEWPYKAIWSANSTVDASTPQEAEDSPDLTLEANFNQFAISDVYQMYLMYVPPGNNSQYVPLHRLTWNWNANQATQNSNGSWPPGAAGSVTISDDSRCYDHPAWQNKYVNPH